MAITGDPICYCGCHEGQATTVLAKQHNRDVAAAAIVRQLVDALEAYGQVDTVGRWHEEGCQLDRLLAPNGDPLDRCSYSRCALTAARAWLEQEAK